MSNWSTAGKCGYFLMVPKWDRYCLNARLVPFWLFFLGCVAVSKRPKSVHWSLFTEGPSSQSLQTWPRRWHVGHRSRSQWLAGYRPLLCWMLCIVEPWPVAMGCMGGCEGLGCNWDLRWFFRKGILGKEVCEQTTIVCCHSISSVSATKF